MPNCSGLTSSYPLSIDTFNKQSNAIKDPTTGNMIGDVIPSLLKNRMSDAICSLERDLSAAPVPVGDNVRVSAVTRALIDVRPEVTYSLYIPGNVADFLGRGSLAHNVARAVHLTSFRPYYNPYDAAVKTKLVDMWSRISADSSVRLAQQFVVWYDAAKEQQINIRFNPSAAVTGHAAWTENYDPESYGAGAFIVSLIFMSYN